MFDTYLGNAASIERLRSWVAGGAKTSLILFGIKGLSLRQLAEESAKEILKVDTLAISPDYHYIEPDEKEKIGVEAAEEIVHIASYKPAGEHHVILVDSMEKMTVQCQNRLLKTIEDDEKVVLIGIVYGNGILDTIKSRVLCLEFKPLSKDEFFKLYRGKEKIMAYALSMGCPEGVNDDMAEFYKPVIDAISLGEEKELIKILSLYKEKDEHAFFSSKKNEVLCLLNLLEWCYMDILRYLVLNEVGDICQPQAVKNKSEIEARIELIEQEKSRVGSSSYTKDDFFLFICRLIETV